MATPQSTAARNQLKDLTGQRFGRLEVVSLLPDRRRGSAVWLCRCDCGRTASVLGGNLTRGHSTSCGRHKRTPQFIDITGRVFGRLTVLKRAGDVARRPMWRCRCECGVSLDARGDHLRSGASRSCGCRQRVVTRLRNLKHGHTAGSRNSPEWTAWNHIRCRCGVIAGAGHPRYAGRGIAVCGAWAHDFEAFYTHVGRRPSARHSIDRIDNDRDYEPGNVRWATRTTQARNTSKNVRLTFAGFTKCAAEWGGRIGLTPGLITKRKKRKWSDAEALLTPHGARRNWLAARVDRLRNGRAG